jgi:hypothetical protein
LYWVREGGGDPGVGEAIIGFSVEDEAGRAVGEICAVDVSVGDFVDGVLVFVGMGGGETGVVGGGCAQAAKIRTTTIEENGWITALITEVRLLSSG